ncbi:calcium-binding protein [Azospirillum doebereinerae]
MSRLVAGSGFALDFDEARLAGGFVFDAFTTQPAMAGLAAGANGVETVRSVDGRWHRTSLSYTGTGAGSALTVRVDGLGDYDAAGALRYRIEGIDVTLPANALDRLGARVFQGIGEIAGAGGDDSFYMGIPAGRLFDGGAGTDRAIYGADPRRYALRDGAYRAETPVVVALPDGRYAVVSSTATDTLAGVEFVTIDGRTTTTALAATAFDPVAYLAGNRDLVLGFGTDPVAAARHYVRFGRNERRPTDGFDAYAYLGSNPDLLAGYGVDKAAAARHYLEHGLAEGRPLDGFDVYAYLASNPDLLAAYGADAAAALSHYGQHGRGEGRGTAGFDGLSYLAANPDLAGAYGFDAAAGARHYVLFGRSENRPLRFDAASYLAANPDLAAGFGGNEAAALDHYILHGRAEGRALRSADTPAAAFPLSLQAASPQAAALVGTTGNDTLVGTAGTDALGNPLTDSVDGLAGIDTFVLTGAIASYSLSFDGNGALVVSGPDGTDTLAGVELLQATDGVFPVGALVGFAQPALTGRIVSAAATAGDDYLVGTANADAIAGGGGNDLLVGLTGNDLLFGNPGNDTLLGGDGLDTLEGGAGNDRLFGGAGGDRLNGDLVGVSGNDTLLGEDGNDWLDGGDGMDWLDGGAGNDTLYAGMGADVLRGGAGDDLLFGDVYSDRTHEIAVDPKSTISHEDVLLGGAGNDTLVGGYGADLVSGGAGGDVFSVRNLNESTLAAPDVILDFNGEAVMAASLLGLASYATVGAEGDRIDLSEIDAVEGAGNDAFTFIGTANFTAAGQLRYQASGAVTLIEGNVNADMAADFRLQVNLANYTFSAFDFIF